MASGLLAFGFVASEPVGFRVVFPRLMVSGMVVAGSMVFLCGVRFLVADLAAAGFEALGLA